MDQVPSDWVLSPCGQYNPPAAPVCSAPGCSAVLTYDKGKPTSLQVSGHKADEVESVTPQLMDVAAVLGDHEVETFAPPQINGPSVAMS